MKVTKITIDSIYGIKHLELDGKPVELVGAKGVGKTSVIDSIRYLLTNKSPRDFIIKNGANEGEILIETDTGLSVNRKKRLDKSDSFKVLDNGKNVTSPASFISEIFTELQLNPVEFASWDKNKQNRAILDLIEFSWDMDWIKTQFGEIPSGVNYSQHILKVLDDIQSTNGDYWKRREEANRKEYYKRQQIADMMRSMPQNYELNKWEKYSLADKVKELETKRTENNKIEKAQSVVKNFENTLRGIEAEKSIKIEAEKSAINSEKTSLLRTIERLEAELKAANEKLGTLDSKLQDKINVIEAETKASKAEFSQEYESAKKHAQMKPQDISELCAEIDNAEKMKSYISEYKSMLNMQEERKQLEQESQVLTEKIQKARSLPGEVLSQAKLPIEGLTVVNGVPMVDLGEGALPINNLSDGQRIELCVDIAIAKTDNLKIILINGAEALDDASRDKLYDKCKKAGLQIIAARTTNDNEFKIIEL